MPANKKTEKKTITKKEILKTRPTKEELREATQKAMKKYHIALKNLARR